MNSSYLHPLSEPAEDKLGRMAGRMADSDAEKSYGSSDARSITDEPKMSSFQREELEELVRMQKERSNTRAVGIVVATSLAMLLIIASTSGTSVALPSIGEDFNVGPNELQWHVTTFALSSGCFLILFGRLADIYGRKLIFILGVIFMTIFSIGCGFANNNNTLVIMRTLQGIGPAAMVPAALGILARAFPTGRARSTAFASFSAGAPIGSAFGSQLGGVATQLAPSHWRATFFVQAGIAALVLILGLLFIENDKPFPFKIRRSKVVDVKGKVDEEDRRVDWLGALLVTGGLALLMFVLGDGTVAPRGWKTGYVIALLVISIVILLAFVGWEYYLQEYTTFPPLMRLDIWTRGRGKMAAMMFVVFFLWSGFISWTLWSVLYYQQYLLLTPILTMIRMLPMFVSGVLCNVVVALVVGIVPAHYLIVGGCLVASIAPLLFAIIDTSKSYWPYGFPAAICSVVGADFAFATGTLYVAKLALQHEQSLAAALFQTLTQIGSSFGVTITTSVHNSFVEKVGREMGVVDETSAPREAVLVGFRSAEWTAFGFAVLGALLGAVFLRGVGVVGHRNSKSSSATERDVEAAQMDEKDIKKG